MLREATAAIPRCLRTALPVCLLTFSVLTHCSEGPDRTPVARNGVVDFRKVDVSKSKPIALNGEWAFFPGRFVADSAIADQFLYVPGVWNDAPVNDSTMGSYGYATYQLTLLIPATQESHALFIPDLGTAYQIFANGVKIGGAGKTGVTEADSIPAYRPQIVLLPESDTIRLTIHISNFQNRWGGAWYPIEFGSLEALKSRVYAKEAMSSFAIGATAVMTVFGLVLYLFRTKDPTPLYFSIHCLLLLVRTVTTDTRMAFVLFPDSAWTALNRLEYISLYLAGVVFYQFMNSVVKWPFWKRFGIYFYVPFLVSTFLAAFFPNEIYTLSILPISFLTTLIIIPAWFVVSLRFALKGKSGGFSLFIGFAAVGITVVNDALVTYYLVDTGYWIPYGQVILIFAHSILVAQLSSTGWNRSEGLSDRLKTMVSATRRIMSSDSGFQAARTASEDLSTYLRYHVSGAALYIRDEKTTERWQRYALNEGDGFSSEACSPDLESVLTKTEEPVVFREKSLLPVTINDTRLAILELPVASMEHLYQESDLVTGITYTLALAMQNLVRQEREKLASLGEVAAQIVHDIGHHTAILRNLLMHIESDASGARSEVIRALSETDSLSNLSLDILEFARDRVILDLKNLNARSFAEEVKSDVQALYEGTGMTLNVRCDMEGEIRLDPLRMRRVIHNLVRNTADATEGRGNLEIRFEREYDSVYMIFEDDGPGLSVEARMSLYQPILRSTRPKGSGLGLSIVRKIVQSHGGEILLDTERTTGCRFTIVLPDRLELA